MAAKRTSAEVWRRVLAGMLHIHEYRLAVRCLRDASDLAFPRSDKEAPQLLLPQILTPHQLIDDTIDKLETLSGYLSDEVENRAAASRQLTSEARACKEALQTIRILIPKLHRARSVQITNRAQMQFRECLHCE
jgi:hypothetical protein